MNYIPDAMKSKAFYDVSSTKGIFIQLFDLKKSKNLDMIYYFHIKTKIN